jgi:adenylate kinase
MVLVFFGPPGSGKGTQAQYLVHESGFIHISTGQLLRNEINSAGDYADLISQKLNTGEFVSDDIILGIVEKFLDKADGENLIFDGFPRTEYQAKAFDSLLNKKGIKVDLVVDFQVDLQQLINRIVGRYVCSTCGSVYHEVTNPPKQSGICDFCGGTQFDRRSDDTSDVLKRRVDVYKNETEIVKEFYLKKGVLVSVNASRLPLEVKEEVQNCLQKAGLEI